MPETFTVSELCDAVRTAVEETFPDEVWVSGAISSLTRSGNGHVYFDLVDAQDDLGAATAGIVPVALFSTKKQLVNKILQKSGSVRMDDGIEIRIRGRVAYYPPQGRIQLVMSLIDPAYTVGQMAMARQALLEALRVEGLLHANRALELTPVPLRIGLVTSEASAAHADFQDELRRSGYPFDVSLFDCRVQGIDAVPSLVEGVKWASEADVDVVVLIRGGGARTDLVAFDAEPLARAIACCGRPVIVGVGHEVDRSVADEVAHSSEKTPTAAAGLLIDTVRRFVDDVETAASRLVNLAVRGVESAEGDLTGDANRLVVAANAMLVQQATTLSSHASQLTHSCERLLDRADAHLDQAQSQLRALDPTQLLARGWTITKTADGKLLTDPAAVSDGATLHTTTAGGTLISTVAKAPVGTAPETAPEDA